MSNFANGTKKLTIAAVAMVAVIAGLAYCNNIQQKNDRAAHDLEAAKAVAVLAPGVEEAWLAYVDRRVAATMHRIGTNVRVTGMLEELTSQTTIVSANSPYQISCDRIGGSVTFGYGEDATSVSIFGLLLSPSAEKPPALGVHPDSIAAKILREKLCLRLSERVQAVMAAQ